MAIVSPLAGAARLRPPIGAAAPRARTTATRPQRPATHGATARGSRPRPGRRWQLPAAWSQGAAPQPGLPPARAAASRSGHQQGQHRQPVRYRPKAAALAHAEGVQLRHLRRVATTVAT
ncbi:hypothetical protein BHM03_00059834 [Ensete ventricosum]|nr:hypothetical protein BHM03_00059834 [Ensete ventricosum]